MSCVESNQIKPLFDQAIYMDLQSPSDFKFYYSRQFFLENIFEMMGTKNFVNWFVLNPFLQRQHHIKYLKASRQFNEHEVEKAFKYMMFDKQSLKDLVALQYQIEVKSQEQKDSVQDFRLPSYLEDLIRNE